MSKATAAMRVFRDYHARHASELPLTPMPDGLGSFRFDLPLPFVGYFGLKDARATGWGVMFLNAEVDEGLDMRISGSFGIDPDGPEATIRALASYLADATKAIADHEDLAWGVVLSDLALRWALIANWDDLAVYTAQFFIPLTLDMNGASRERAKGMLDQIRVSRLNPERATRLEQLKELLTLADPATEDLETVVRQQVRQAASDAMLGYLLHPENEALPIDVGTHEGLPTFILSDTGKYEMGLICAYDGWLLLAATGEGIDERISGPIGEAHHDPHMVLSLMANHLVDVAQRMTSDGDGGVSWLTARLSTRWFSALGQDKLALFAAQIYIPLSVSSGDPTIKQEAALALMNIDYDALVPEAKAVFDQLRENIRTGVYRA